MFTFQVIKNIPVLRLTNIVVITTNKIFELFVTHYSSADTMLPYRTGVLYMCYSVIQYYHIGLDVLSIISP